MPNDKKIAPQDYIAHIRKDGTEWAASHRLEEHLQKVALLTEAFANNIDSEAWGSLAGKWHDLGKYRKRFQDYIRLQNDYETENAHIENGTRAPHSTAGAIHAIKELGPGLGHILAYMIAGHHAGLPDWEGGKGGLSIRLEKGLQEYTEALAEKIPPAILKGKAPPLPAVARSADTVALWIRLLFSCLVDADFLDTESYMNPDKSAQRPGQVTLAELQSRFDLHMHTIQKNADKTALNAIRLDIQNACLTAAQQPPGLFSLTVPTGGGKTLSSLAFALAHAQKFNKLRIIYAIPFTSIIEQNAQVFRSFLGEDAVLEHHSNLDQSPELESSRSRLAAENWDSPLIVTTNVQLFESLHSARTSRCRKLHNLVNSVIILDEAQQLPRDFHAPITDVMKQLSDNFGVTWVLCTATQPALGKSADNFGQTLVKGLENIREIIPDPVALAKKLQRVEIQLPKPGDKRISWIALADMLREHQCLLAIVNTRNDAKTLYTLLADDRNTLHLSANMCAEHRTHVIADIKHRLALRRQGDTRPLRVISTQLIEAGVDVDFPVVFRAMAGLDSIAQAAGRCNREGQLAALGKVIVFLPEKAAPQGFLRQGEETTRELIASGSLVDPLSPASFHEYFSLLNHRGDRDVHGILPLLKAGQSADAPLSISFRTAAEKFRLIDDNGISIVVPYISSKDEVESPIEMWISALEKDASQKWVYRKLQRYTVSVPESRAQQLEAAGYLESRAGLWVLLSSSYHDELGVNLPESILSAESSVVF